MGGGDEEGRSTTAVKYHVGDVMDMMAGMADNSVDLLVTSPP